MWHSRHNRDGATVVCIACGTSLPRSEAREYDKQGNRWERHGKSFEHLCKECYRDLCHQPRDELEALLIDVERAVDSGDAAERRADSASTRDRPLDGDADADRPLDADADRPLDADTDADRRRDDADRQPDSGPNPELPRDSTPDIEAWTGGERDHPTDPEPDDRDAAESARPDETKSTFLAEYFRAVEERYGPAEEPGRES